MIMDRNKLTFYGGLVFSIALNVIIFTGIIVTRFDKSFWIFMFISSAFQAVGIIHMLSWDVNIKTSTKHSDSLTCNCDNCKIARLNILRKYSK